MALASCTSEKVVYRSTPAFTTPPTAAANFVGYSQPTTKQTVCGNCHVDQQAKWLQTKHSSAWADLQASGHASAACVACHSVSKLGNAATSDSVGYIATSDPRYQDVQCESCHGAGLQHVTAPALGNRPLASIAVDTGAAINSGCGECHTGTHEPFVDEWRLSKHSNVEAAAVSGGTECQGCHTAQGALQAFGVNTAYLEQGQVSTKPLAIVCAVCHDPHSPANGKQLRFSVSSTDPTQNLCVRCHQRRSAPDPTSSRGPHSPEGPTLLGYAGWWPPSFQLVGGDTIVATHGSASNPNLCATCHVARFAVNDPKTGNLTFQATGHKFVAIPCLDSNGIPTTGTCDISQRTFAACTGSGCHGSQDVARSAMITVGQRITTLENTLSGMIAKVPKTEFSTTDTRFTTGEGAQFNLQLAQSAGSYVHNPFLIEALLTASIKQITLDYGIAPSNRVDLRNILRSTAH
jgi:predicted CXXCH cytochrome family protein